MDQELKFLENIEEFIRKTLEELVINKEMTSDMETMIQQRKLSEIKQYYEQFNSKSNSNSKKFYAKKLIESEQIINTLFTLEYDKLNFLIKYKDEYKINVIEDLDVFIQFYFSFYGNIYEENNEYYFVIVDEVKQAISSMSDSYLNDVKKVSDLAKLVSYCIEFYGVIDCTSISIILYRIYGIQYQLDDIKNAAMKYLVNLGNAIYYKNYFCSIELDESNNNEIEFIINEQRKKPRYIPDKDVFEYFPENQFCFINYEDMKILYEKLVDLNLEFEIIVDIEHIILNPHDNIDVIDFILSVLDNKLNEIDDLQELLEIINDLLNKKVKWSNNGYSSDELLKVTNKK